ncbi:SUMF1/EgtB/PvdO family nonheme iron enzyme [Flavitalea antarctica]
MNGQIFISYRRDDSLGSTGRIYDRLLEHFSAEQIFMDVDTIPLGEDFVEYIEKAVTRCDVLLAVIGRDWVTIQDRNGRRMLDSDGDFVRAEIRAALQRKVKVIPVLVENADVPSEEDLPDDLKPLARRNAIELRHTAFHADVDKLIKVVQRFFQEEEEKIRIRSEQEMARQKQLEMQEKEEQDWNHAVGEDSIESYSVYLNLYANGKYAADATTRINALQDLAAQQKKQQDFDRFVTLGTQAYEQQHFEQALVYFDEARKLFAEKEEIKEWRRKCEEAIVQKQREEYQKKEARQRQQEEEAQKKAAEEERLRQAAAKLAEEKRIELQVRDLEQRGDKLRKKKDYRLALACFEQAVALQPNRQYSQEAIQVCRAEIQAAEAERQRVLEEEKREQDLEKKGGENTAGSSNKKKWYANQWLIAGGGLLLIGVVTILLFSNKKGSSLKKDETAKLPPKDTVRKTIPISLPDTPVNTPISQAARLIWQQMVPIAGDSFVMGSNKKTTPEWPEHTVAVDSFLLSKYEITGKQWNDIMNVRKYKTSLNVPATTVSWDDVQEFIEKLNAASGRQYRLPTEAEWEYACIKGHGNHYRSILNEYSWNVNNSNDSLHPVGQTIPNALGIYDMLGNAYEWCADSKGAYQSSQKDENKKIIRGGDYKSKIGFVSPKVRNWNLKAEGRLGIGFRLAMDEK